MRKLNLLFLLVISTLVLPLFSADVPKIVFEKTIVEVGKVKKGEKVKAEFKFRNEGNSILRIISLTPA